jgi:mannose-6-phosphate isomerase
MYQLYPLKFRPILKEKIWGGNKLHKHFNKETGSMENCGESWELSAVENDVSVVSNGYLAGNDLQDLVEVYMGDLVGDSVYEQFGPEFPLLIKFIDASDDLSIQVHPNDAVAKERHNAYGKTEMWYVLESDRGSRLITGFNKDVKKDEYLNHLNNSTLSKILNFEEVQEGDVFFIPAERVHAIGKGIMLAEIQQTSDITYRIYDYNRKDADGNGRELHTDLAIDVLDYKLYNNYRTEFDPQLNKSTNLVKCKYFSTNFIEFDQMVEKDFVVIDSFVIYMCLEGELYITYGDGDTETLSKGETVLIPAELKNITLTPTIKSKILEVFIPQKAQENHDED